MPVCRPPSGNDMHSVQFGRRQVCAEACDTAIGATAAMARAIDAPIRKFGVSTARRLVKYDPIETHSNPSLRAHQRTAPALAGAASQKFRSESAAALRPHDALVAGLHHADTLEVELLDAFALVGLGRIDVALGVGGDAVHAEDLAGLAPAATERREVLHGVAIDDAHALILPVGQV